MPDFLNQAKNQKPLLQIERGKQVMARSDQVAPPVASRGFPLSQLDALLASGPRFSALDRAAMADDVVAVRTLMP